MFLGGGASSPAAARPRTPQRRTPQKRKPTQQVSIASFIGSGVPSVDENVQFQVPFLPLTAPEEPTPTAFREELPLYAHQQRSLYRMLQIESRNEEVAKFNFGVLDYFSKGGCLADAIGMGKTAAMLALIVSEPLNVTMGGNLVIAPPHLLEQWRMEVEKFVKPGEINVVVGMRRYVAMDPAEISNRTLVLVGVDEAVASRAHRYHRGKLYGREVGIQGRPLFVDLEAMAEYTEAAKFVHKAYSGIVWVTSLHLPVKPWRRVVFEEVQDLVLPGKESQDCFVQLTRKCENVWLITATPFPRAADSIYANNQLLGFKRLRLMPKDPAFDDIKRKLYLRNCAQVKQDAITSKIKVTETYISVKLHPRELLMYQIERIMATSKNSAEDIFAVDDVADGKVHTNTKPANDAPMDAEAANSAAAASKRLWSELFKCARQSAVHAGISDRVLDRERAKTNASATIKTPADVFKNEKYHLDRQLAVANMRKKEVQAMEAATRNTVAICKAILRHVYWNVRDCFADMEKSGLAEVFNDRSETEKGFRMLSRHGQWVNQQPPEPMDLILYHQDEIEDYLRKHFDASSKIEYFCSVMESTLNERCPRALVVVNEELKQIEECMQLKRSPAVLDETTPIPHFGSKITHLMHYLKRLPRIKVVIFTMWDGGLKVLEKALRQSEITCAVFLQHQSSETKAAHVLRFLTGDTQVLLLNSLTSASGINLQVASHVIFMDPVGFSAAQASTLEQQAIGRVLRMGQTNKEVTVVRFVAEKTMEAALYDEIHATTTKAVQADDSFFDGEQTDGNAYVCEGFDQPTRRVVRMEIRSAAAVRALAAGANVGTGDDEEDQEIAIEGTMSLEDAINQRIEAASAEGIVVDLTEDGDEIKLPPALLAAATPAPSKRRRVDAAAKSFVSPSALAQEYHANVRIKNETPRVKSERPHPLDSV